MNVPVAHVKMAALVLTDRMHLPARALLDGLGQRAQRVRSLISL
jgi:hypothetical protein